MEQHVIEGHAEVSATDMLDVDGAVGRDRDRGKARAEPEHVLEVLLRAIESGIAEVEQVGDR